MATIADRHDLCGELRPEPDGSAVVFGIGDDWIVKLHEPWNAQLAATEVHCLAATHGRLHIESPRLIFFLELVGVVTPPRDWHSAAHHLFGF